MHKKNSYLEKIVSVIAFFKEKNNAGNYITVSVRTEVDRKFNIPSQS